MELSFFIEQMNNGTPVLNGSELHNYMSKLSYEAMQVTCTLNNSFHSPDGMRALFSQLIGKQIDSSFSIFPPFHTDCGKNITIGKNVFINSGCHFQDQGGITIKDGALIGHNVTLATLNHGIAPEDRHSLYPAPIVIGENVWIGSGSVIVPGVTIGENSVVGAGSVVTKDVPANTIVAGAPAKSIRTGINLK